MTDDTGGFTIYDHKQQLSHGVWVFNRGNKEWSEEMNRNMEILNDLARPGTLTITDSNNEKLVEYNGSSDKVLVLPSSDSRGSNKTSNSFKYNINKRFTTLYLTEDAIRYLGYSDFEDAKAIKYRSEIYSISASDTYNTTPISSDGYGAIDNNGSTIQGSGNYYYAFTINPNLKVNVLEPKTIGYLNDLITYFFGSSFNNIVNENNLNTKLDSDLIPAGKGNIRFYITLFDSNNNKKCYVKFQTAIRYLYEQSSPVTSFEGPNGIINTYKDIQRSVKSNILSKFEGNDSIYIAVFNDSNGSPSPLTNSYGEHDYDGILNFQTLDEFNNAINDIDSTAVVVKLYDYDSFQDVLEPTQVEVLPIQVPSTYNKVSLYGSSDEQFDVYAFYIRMYDNVNYVTIYGQNIGNGIIVGDRLAYTSVFEEDNVCGTTEFTEIYPM